MRTNEMNLDVIAEAANASLAIVTFDPKGTIVSANAQFADLMGYQQNELMGKHHSLFLPFAERRSEEYLRFWEGLREGHACSSEFRRITQGHHDIWIRASYSPIKDESGQVVRVVKFAFDVTNEKLKANSESQKLAALDKSNARVAFDRGGIILSANQNFLYLLGYQEHELIGKHHSMLVGQAEREANSYHEFWERLLEGEFFTGEFKRVTQSGREVWIRGAYNPILDDRGRVERVEKFALDITNEKELSVAQDGQLKAIYRSAAIVEFDPQGVILNANSIFLNLVSYGLNEIQNRHHSIFLSDDDFESAAYREFWNQLRQGIFQQGEFLRYDKYGQPVWIRGVYNPVFDTNGKVTKVIKFAFDVSGVKQAENLMRIQNAELDIARLRAEEATLAKSTFLANLSHEIRTPMNGIIGMCNLMLGAATEPTQIERLKILQGSSNSLLALLNDVLDLSKLEAEKMTFESKPFNLRDLVHEVVELHSSRASEKGLSLESHANQELPEALSGDGNRLRQILNNLISNAIKFTSRGKVSVGINGKLRHDGTVKLQIAVKDTGIGIDSKVSASLFKPFAQADESTSRRFGGTGLGLAICKRLCESMGGTIALESELGAGSTFIVNLILAKSDEEIPSSSINPFAFFDSEMGLKNPLRILVAEDNRTNQIVVTGLLENLGYTATIANNGVEVLKALSDQTFDLILLDCHMPLLDGFQTAAQIRTDFEGRRKPRIVALTASTVKHDIERCFASGMDDHIAKPIAIDSLARVLLETSQVLKQNGLSQMNDPRAVESFEEKEESTPIDFHASESSTSEHSAATSDFAQDTSQPSFDRVTFLAKFAGMEKLSREVIADFFLSVGDLEASLESALQGQKQEEIEIAAHSLKGVLSNFYATTAVQLARKIETDARDGQMEDIAKTYERLTLELQFLKHELNEFRTELEAA